MAKVVRFLSSIRLAIVLLILIIGLSIIGTLIPQGQEIDFYRQRWPSLSEEILYLGFDHLYRSPLFLSLIFLFLLNLLACSIKQIPAKFQRLKGLSPEAFRSGGSLKNKKLLFRLGELLAKNPLKLKSFFQQQHYQVKVAQIEDKKYFLARKGLTGLFGPELVHLGLIIIIVGGLVSALFSQRITIALLEGQAERIPEKSFSLRLDKFSTEFYPDGAVKDWKSLISVIDNGQVQFQKTVEVNHPFTYGGLKFFQMSYGLDWDQVQVELEIKFSGSPAQYITLKNDSYHQIDERRLVRLLSFIPDFQLDSSGQVISRSAEARNPAALVEIHQDGQPLFSGWVFYYHPDLSRFQRRIGSAPEVRLRNFSAPPFSVLEASSDPGTNLVWVGSLLMLLGLLTSFYFPYKELRILIEPGREPLVTAFSRKNRDSFIQELEGLTELISNTKKISKEISDE